MATDSSGLAWKIPWTEESGEQQSMELQRVGHDSATNTTTTLLQGYQFWESGLQHANFENIQFNS